MKKIAVVGDFMFDKYNYGALGGTCQEAPIPKFEKISTEYRLGGAGRTRNETPEGVLGSRENGVQNNQEQDAKMTREQGAEESNLGSMEHRVCHKIMVFYTAKKIRIASLGIFAQK